MKRIIQLTEEEYAELLDKALATTQDNSMFDRIKYGFTTEICVWCGCNWAKHKTIVDRECSHITCMKCGDTCIEDVCDLKKERQ